MPRRPRRPAERANDSSYRGRVDWNADRYGLAAEHLTVEPNFNPEVGFLRRTSFRRSYGQARYSPRPGWRGVRKVYYIGSVDYITDIANRPESKEVQATYQMELNSSDIWNVDVSRNYERLTKRFEVGRPAVRASRRVRVHAGPRHIHAGISATGVRQHHCWAQSGFYDGTLSEVTWRGRVEISKQIYARANAVVEPRRRALGP